MSTTQQDTAWALFERAALDEEDHGYPDGVAFVPGDEDWADGVVWRHLAAGRPTVLVNDDAETLLLPAPRTIRDRVAGHVRVIVKQRAHGHVALYATASALGHHPVRQMRDLALR